MQPWSDAAIELISRNEMSLTHAAAMIEKASVLDHQRVPSTKTMTFGPEQ